MKWGDVILHGIGALVVTGVLVVFGVEPLWAAGINGMLWGVREFVQDWFKGYRPLYIWPIRRSIQKDWEFMVPLVIGFIVSLVVMSG